MRLQNQKLTNQLGDSKVDWFWIYFPINLFPTLKKGFQVKFAFVKIHIHIYCSKQQPKMQLSCIFWDSQFCGVSKLFSTAIRRINLRRSGSAAAALDKLDLKSCRYLLHMLQTSPLLNYYVHIQFAHDTNITVAELLCTYSVWKQYCSSILSLQILFLVQYAGSYEAVNSSRNNSVKAELLTKI